MSVNKYSWWDLILQIISFFIGKKKEENRQEEQKQSAEELKNKYDELDRQKQKENDKKLEDRMHNIFK